MGTRAGSLEFGCQLRRLNYEASHMLKKKWAGV